MTYRLPLTAAYVLAPALAGAAGAGVFHVSESEVLVVPAVALVLALPALVHVAHGASEQGLVSYGSMLGVTLLSTAAFGGLGYLAGKASCDPDAPENEAEGCSFTNIGLTLAGATLGAAVGYIGYAVYDVASNAVLPPADARDSTSAQALRFWLDPVASTPRERGRLGTVTGVRLGASLQF